MSRRTSPVVSARHSKRRVAVHHSGDKHGFIAREHSLAESNRGACFVDNTNIGLGRLAIWLIGERFRDVSIAVTVETTIL